MAEGTVHCQYHYVPYSLPNQIGVSVLEYLQSLLVTGYSANANVFAEESSYD